MAKRKQIQVLVTLSVKPHISKFEALRELRTRTNDLSCWSIDDGYGENPSNVRVAKIENVR